MKTYLSEIIPTIKRYSRKLDDVSVLKNTHWKLIDESGDRLVYIFRVNNELLVSKNGEVEKGKWEHVGNESLLIEISNKSYLFNQGFYNHYVIGLKKDGVNEYAILIDEKKIDKKIESITDLRKIADLLTTSKTPVKDNEFQESDDEDPIPNVVYLIIFIAFIAILIISHSI